MKRSDSTTLPSGISMRTGPCTITGPDGTTRTTRAIADRSCLVRSDHDQFLFAPAGLEPAGVLEPSRPRGQHRTERNPLLGKYFDVEAGAGERRQCLPGYRELGLHQQHRAAVGE